MHTPLPVQGHVVSFYDHDEGLVAQVAAFLAPALAQGDRAVVVCTPSHAGAVVEELRAGGLDVDSLRREGVLVVADAVATLASLLVEGALDRGRFREVAVPMLGGAPASTRVFGEIVALLLAAGEPGQAVQLEGFWNELAHEQGFSVMCGYPSGALHGLDLRSATQVCAAHTEVLPPESYATGHPGVADSAVFLPVPSAVAAARRFVADTLVASGEQELLGDAALVLSGLATNAVRHVGSAFRVSVSRPEGAARIDVEDVGTEPPRRRRAGPESLGGRGVAIVEDLSRRWGCELTAEGKRVWAELRPAAGARPPGRA